MKASITVSQNIYSGDNRMDASFYTSSGIQTKNQLEQWSRKANRKTDRLSELADLFNGPRFPRFYVNEIERSIPFLSSSDMLQADLSDVKRLSLKRTPKSLLESIKIERGWTLISCSGTIGNCVYVRPDMDAMKGSQHIMRVVPKSQIPSGYLFTFLSSSMGYNLLTQGTFGAVIQHIEPYHIKDIPVPRLDLAVEKHIHTLVEQASTLRTQANVLLEQAKNEIEQHVGFRKPRHSFDHAYSLGTASIDSNFGMRLDAFGYIGYVEDALKTLDKYTGKVMSAQEVGYEFFNPPIFKRMFADSGHPYMSAVNFYNLHPLPERYLSRLQPDVDQYLIRKGMVLVQNAGQRYGLITKPLFVTETLDGIAVTSDVVRISHTDPIENGYICGLLSTNFGRRLALRYSYGTSIPRLDVPKFSLIKIPYPEDNFRRRIGKFVVDAYQQREQANVLEDQAQVALSNALHT